MIIPELLIKWPPVLIQPAFRKIQQFVNRSIFLLTLLTCFSPLFVVAQQLKPYKDFSVTDSLSRNIKYKNDIYELTKDLTKAYPEHLDKARAIFKWITENIKYDYKYFNKNNYKGKEPKTYKCKDDKDCEAKRIAWEIKYIDKVLRKGKAVCQGYAMLFKKMCDIAGLQSEIVTGYVRTEYYQVGTAGTLDHAWNVVWIDSTYYLLDATWAAGGCAKNEDGKLLSFSKNYNDYYWLTPPADFGRNHYPQNNKWTLLTNYTKDSFSLNPYYAPGAIENIKLISPASGIINAKKGDSIYFKLAYNGNINYLQINSNIFYNPPLWVLDNPEKRKPVLKLDTLAQKKQQYIKYKQEGGFIEFEYIVPDNSLYYLDILFDRQRIMRFKVNTSGK